MDASEDRRRQEEMEIFWGVRLGECIRGRAPYNPDDASSLLSALEIILDPRRESHFHATTSTCHCALLRAHVIFINAEQISPTKDTFSSDRAYL